MLVWWYGGCHRGVVSVRMLVGVVSVGMLVGVVVVSVGLVSLRL